MIPLLGIVQVQLAAVAAALGAMLLGSVAYLLRRAFGLVKPPPPEEEVPH